MPKEKGMKQEPLPQRQPGIPGNWRDDLIRSVKKVRARNAAPRSQKKPGKTRKGTPKLPWSSSRRCPTRISTEPGVHALSDGRPPHGQGGFLV